MNKKIKSRVDHFGLFCKEGNITDPFFKMGFVAAGGADHFVINDGKPAPGAGALIFDNAYIECSVKDYSDPIYPKGGVVYFQYSTSDANKAHNQLKEAGFNVVDVATMSRYADHGKEKGEASFTFFRSTDDIIPNMYLGSVQHNSLNLMYQDSRYAHKNGVYSVDNLTICCEEELNADNMEASMNKFYSCVGEMPEKYGVKTISIMDKQALAETFGVNTSSITTNMVGVSFLTDDINKVTNLLDRTDYKYYNKDGRVVVDFIEKMNIFITFEQK